MSDLPKRLRQEAGLPSTYPEDAKLMFEAAEEIEKLARKVQYNADVVDQRNAMLTEKNKAIEAKDQRIADLQRRKITGREATRYFLEQPTVNQHRILELIQKHLASEDTRKEASSD